MEEGTSCNDYYKNHGKIFRGGYLRCAFHSVDQMFSHESDIISLMTNIAIEKQNKNCERIEDFEDERLRRIMTLMQILYHNQDQRRSVLEVPPDALFTEECLQRDPGEILMYWFSGNELWKEISERIFGIEFRFENFKKPEDVPKNIIVPIQIVDLVPRDNDMNFPLPSIQQYLLRSFYTPDMVGNVMRINNLPSYLLIQINCIQYTDDGKHVKSYPNHLKDDDYLKISIIGTIYELCGIVVHIGSNINFGHYVYIQKIMNDWVVFDDLSEKTYIKTGDKIFNQQFTPYVLLYRFRSE